jgi:beta-N-acetylhexosaminidase
MNAQEKIGQMFMIGFDGTHLPQETKKLIKDYKIGGVILFRRNVQDPSQLFDLCKEIQSLSKGHPPFIAVDHEGGRVCRLPPPFTQFPNSLALGRRKSYSLTYSMAEVMAKELKAVGINMNMAPVLDVNTNPLNPVIGDRSFGDSPTRVSSLGLAVVGGLQDHGMIACGKHFPGHGDTSMDSHEKLPTVNHSIERLQEVDLKPFVHAISNGLSSVMTAHVLYPSLDAKYPATLSKKITHTLLRQSLGFEGVVVSDDMEMGAISHHWEMGKASVKAILAGVDLLLICHESKRQIEGMESVFRAVDSGKIPQHRLEASLKRILLLKDRFLKKEKGWTKKQAIQTVGCSQHRHISERINTQVALPS